MEAEVIALAHSCRDLLPVKDMFTFFGDAVSLSMDLTSMHTSTHEDIAAVLILADTLPTYYTPESKYYTIKTI